ncbi:Stemmadenine O-acetyltransferase-like protein [Drosera capensis]
MGCFEVYIDSRKAIKPSTSTPNDKKTYKLCFMDQFMPPYYPAVIYFYQITDGATKLPQLKESLSQALTTFYPFAGRIKDNTAIDCNDEGIPYFEARVDCCMREFLKEADLQLLQYFLPCKKVPTEPMTELHQIAIQVTVFTCGGLAIGARFNHKVMDAASAGCFMKHWAANSSGCHDGLYYPDFTAASKVFPPIEHISSPLAEFLACPSENKCILKRFTFDAAAIQALKVKARSKEVPNPTRVEVVSSFLWKHAISKITALNHGSGVAHRKTSFLTHAVNIRKYSLSQVPKSFMAIGCLTLPTYASLDLSNENDQRLDVLVGRVHEAVARVDEEYVKKFEGEEATDRMWKSLEIALYDRETIFLCNCLCKLGINEIDFGWGKPVWISPWGEPPTLAERNSLTLIDTNGGEGIEAWFVLQEHEMAALECDEEFLTYAAPSTEPDVNLLQHFIPCKRIPDKPMTEIPLLAVQFFPPSKNITAPNLNAIYGPEAMCKSKRYVFDATPTQALRDKARSMNVPNLTRWCNLGGEEIDFGWGKPVWVCPCPEPPTLLERNTFILMDIDNRKGIEAWCIVQEEDVARLERDHELLEFATPISGVYGLTA